MMMMMMMKHLPQSPSINVPHSEDNPVGHCIRLRGPGKNKRERGSKAAPAGLTT